ELQAAGLRGRSTRPVYDGEGPRQCGPVGVLQELRGSGAAAPPFPKSRLMSRIAPDLITISAVGLLCVWMGMRYALTAHPRSYFVAQGLLFACLTLLLRACDIIPFEVLTVPPGHATQRVLGEIIEIAWWLIGAWLVRAFLRFYLRLRSGQRQTTLVEEILGALIYLVAIIAILTYVWDLPIKGLLATSGALAIVVG